MTISVKNRILLLGMIPLAIALWFIGLVIVDDYNLMNSLKKMEPATQLNIKIGAYIHEVQKERGATGIFLGSKGTKFRSQLTQQRTLTDQKWATLSSYIKTQDKSSYTPEFEQILNNSIQLALAIPALRKDIDSLSISASKALEQYTRHNSQWLDVVQATAELTENVDVSHIRLTYASFSRGKERAGIERAILSSIFSDNVLTSEALKKATHLVAEQRTYFSFFRALASPEQLHFYQQKMSSPIVQKVQDMRDKLIKKIDNLEKNSLTFQLYGAIGYGGAIHQFKNYVLRGKEKYYTGFIASYEKILSVIAQLEKVKNLTPEGRQALATIKSVFAQYRTAINHVKRLVDEGESIADIDSMVSISDKPAVEGLHRLVKDSSLGNFGVDPEQWFKTITGKINLLKEVDDFISHDMAVTGQQLADQVQTHFYTLLALTVLVIMVVGWGVFYVARGIIGPLEKSVEFAQAIANNDLSRKLAIDQADEVGDLARALNSMADNLVQMVSQLASNSSNLNNYSQQMKNSSEDVSMSIDQQSHKTTEALAVAQTVVADAEHVAIMSTDAARSAAEAGETASQGGQVVTQAITSIQAIADIVNNSASSVVELNKLGENISSIINVIEGIAEQTNLLALNAAIEAARAGEQGRGFAVVADEVRQLAQRTAEATHEVATSIKSIQENTHQVSQQMLTGTESAARSVELAGQASNALNEIVSQSAKVADMIDSIAGASGKQVEEIGQISQNIQAIDELASQSMNAVRQSALVAVELEGSAKELDEQISLFKLA